MIATITARPDFVKIAIQLPTKADGEAFVAKFPKALKLKATTISGSGIDGTRGYVVFGAKLAADDNRGDKNETGIKRYRRAAELLAAAGVTLELDTQWSSFATLAEFDASL